MNEKFYWCYVPLVDEAGTVVPADSFEDAFSKAQELLGLDAGVIVQVQELGDGQEFVTE